MASRKPILVLMAKPPLMGRVKTRLARDIGPAEATAFYRRATRRLLTRLGQDRRWRTVLAVNASPVDRPLAWPDGTERMEQGSGDLGDRLRHVLRHLPRGPVVVLGTDSPQIEPSHVAEAFSALGSREAVFGPAPDGGYWLIGLARRRPLPGLFAGVRWSTEHALGDTAASLPRGVSPAYLSPLTDVDDKESLRQLARDFGPFRFGPWRRQGRRPAGPAGY